MSGTVLSVDLGTSFLKAAIIDFGGNLLSFSGTPYRGVPPASASAWERAFAESLAKLRATRGVDAVCVSGNGPTLVPVTREGAALPVLHWHDGRAAPLPAASSFFLPRAAWLKQNEPELYRKTSIFLSSHEWLSLRLGAPPFTALPQASYEPYYWDGEQCRLFDVEKEKFPPFVKTGSAAGRVSSEAASRFGFPLAAGIPVIAGGPDFITALIGTNALEAGLVCDRAGSSEGVNVCVASPVSARGIRSFPHAKEGLWNAGVVIPRSGSLFEQYRSAAGLREISYEELLSELIPETEDLSLFGGDFFFPEAGDAAPFPAPSSPGEKVSLGRAVLCSMAFSVRSALETLEGQGLAAREARVSGGQGKNGRWNRLKADITGLSLLLPEISDGELTGNAALAVSALEAVSFEKAAAEMVRFRETVKPREETKAFWDARYALYREKRRARLER